MVINESKKKIITVGLFGGSFNPVHIGHMIVASYMVQWGYVDEVWLSLSPCNPLKNPEGLISDAHRLAMLNKAAAGMPGIKVCDIELSMPRPNYTVDTLDTLKARHKNCRFKLIIGSDNLKIFSRWRDFGRIIDEYGLIVYQRPGYIVDEIPLRNIDIVNAPQIDISSTFIRQAVAEGRDIRYFLPRGIYRYINANKLYLKDDQQ